MTTNYTELRRLAEAANLPMSETGLIEHKRAAISAMVDALTPDTVLSLLAELEREEAEIKRMREQEPCAAISRCSLIGAEDCSCGVDGPCSGLINVYLAAGAAPVAQQGWQTIESAPKDGTWVLLWEQYSENPFVGCWNRNAWSASHEHVDAKGGWDGATVIDYIAQELLTHWMPLPAAPEAV